jgi:hypothetical protein
MPKWKDLANEIINLRCDLQLNDIPKVSLTWTLIPRAAVVQINMKSLLALHVFHI